MKQQSKAKYIHIKYSESGDMADFITSWQLTVYDLGMKAEVMFCELLWSDKVSHVTRRM